MAGPGSATGMRERPFGRSFAFGLKGYFAAFYPVSLLNAAFLCYCKYSGGLAGTGLDRELLAQRLQCDDHLFA